ncbi:leucine-rich repeat serine/threonine-protein kinase 1-like isoform X2 [Mytilus californianus]|uniref:leucine-rich repeat serine/threonine-protein kinase 1-like isoform X2 n=1 Tax=Mytilus californianus TaxID=6549 RepID=UPI0022477D27|nr:leucine-rich repeat serine/threonine-protein kinase 1-like isoform X2 [Mytilus californianus]
MARYAEFTKRASQWIYDMVNVTGIIRLINSGNAETLENGLVSVLDEWEESGDDRDILTVPLFEDLPLLNYACTLDDICVDIVIVLISNGCDVNLPSIEGTPLQIISRNGNYQLINILLENGAILETEEDPIFSENSPFYLASLYGHTDVVRRLLSYQPSTSTFNFSQEMVKDDGVRSCLLFAACRGGNLEIVKMWLSPSMDINHPKLFVSSLEDCENGTPLYAACSGGHYDVAKFLYDMGANLTDKICREFPEIAGRILESCISFRDEDFCDEDQEAGHVAKYRHLSLGGFNYDWVAGVHNTIVELDLNENNLSTLPPEIPWCLPNLVHLNLARNKLVKLSSPEGQILCDSLSEIQLGDNKLEDICHEVFQLQSLVTLNLSNNNLKYLLKTLHSQYPVVTSQTTDSSSFVQCPNLHYLNVSQNKLEMLPHEYIRKCSGLSTLDVSHNRLVSFPNAWDCNMAMLNLSHNELDRCPVSLEQYWCGTLRTLRLNNNKLEEINESVVKLGCLVELYANYNKISRLPDPDHWECSQLYLMELSHNCLGPKPTNRRISAVLNKKKEDRHVEEDNYSFPPFLGNCLHDLDLSHNNLNQVHSSVSHLVSLHHLDISHNPAIKTLPKELGKLKVTCMIKMDGVNITDMKKLIDTDCDQQQRSKQIILSLRNDLRQSEKYYKMKLVILGKKDKGKTTLAGLLKGQTLGSHHLLGVQRHDIELPPKGTLLKLFKHQDYPTIKFSLWDMSGDPTVAATHHCFYTPNSLYMLVWDLWSLEKELDKIGQYLYSIQARMPNASILLVATFLDRNTLPTKQQDVLRIKQLLLDRYGPEGDRASGLSSRLDTDSFIPVSCTTKEGISELKEKLYDLATRVPDPNNRPNKLLGRSIPKSYLYLETAMQEVLKTKLNEHRQPFLEHEEFLEIINKVPNNDLDSAEEIRQVTKFLTENGTILHFNDQLKGLNNLYFLDPTWLCDVLSKVLLHVVHDPNVRGGKISKVEVRRIFSDDPRFPDDYVDQYIQLMERFEIALSVDFGGKLFIPSQLSKYPAIDLNRSDELGLKVIRLYKMAFIPSGFWSRLLSRLMYRIELLTSDWILNKSLTSSFTPAKFQKMLERQSSSSSGLQITKKDMIYWEDGLYLGHDSGCLLVEATVVPQGHGMAPHRGVLITVQSTKGDYSIMGIVVDEIDDLLNDHYPGLMEWDEYGQPRVQRYAMCPDCYDSSHSLPKGLDHFSVEHCARLIMSSDTITCPKNLKIPLVQLVPELLMHEIPKKFIIDISKLSVEEDNLLGIGVAGKVLKGHYGGIDVAVKLYHGAPYASFQLSSLDSSYHTGGDKAEDQAEQDDIYKNYSAYTIDVDEANSIKAWRAFMEMRQEVLVTSKLNYPYIVSFLGISIRPSLLMCLEFAPLGNFRTSIDKAIVNREPFNKYRDKDKIFPAVFEKEVTYKMLFQIASGLGYLHKHGIIYRDLKSDNILVFSLELNSPVNVKLSDYGISRFCSSGGTVGLVGTPGYQAPEIIEGQAYDEKVDIFSFSMVIYEALSGRRPFEEYKNLAQISTAMKTQSKRPCLKDYNVDPGFPSVEQLMRDCWTRSADKRPSAEDIVSDLWMRSIQFISLKKTFKLPCLLKDGPIDCMSFTSDSRKAETIWLWEGCEDGRKYTTLDKYTTKDNNGCVPPGDSLPGSRVTCMCQVDKDIWIGTEGYKIETYSHQCFVKKEKKPLCTFATPYAIATSIQFIKQDSQEDKKVYVTLDTGKVMVFEPVNKTVTIRNLRGQTHTSEALCGWRTTKTLTIGNSPATCMAYIPPSGQSRNEIWIGCGGSICVVSNSTCMVEDHVPVQRLVKNAALHTTRMVKSLVYYDDRVWCLINDSAIVIEFDVDLRLPTYIFVMDDYSPTGFVVSEYISGISLTGSSESIDMVSSVLKSVDSCGSKRPNAGYFNLNANFNDVQDENNSDQGEKTMESGDFENDNELNECTWIVSDDKADKSEPPPIPRRTPTIKADPVKLGETPPPVPLRPHRKPPIIPPRSPRPGSRSSSCSSLPKTDVRPKIRVSSSLSGGSHQEIDECIKVCSIVNVGDTLWVGRNYGDILIVNIGQRNSYQYGEVITVLKVTPSAHMGNDVEVLLSTGSSVISLSKTGDSKKGEVISWEPYNSTDIKRIQNYWSMKRNSKDISQETEIKDIGKF